ncbi:MAG: hypothetical protein Q7S27_02360 [Nanoarchaeota archaeon]|nr:hypothetical protein [Nanoarchaeota archaeon]
MKKRGRKVLRIVLLSILLLVIILLFFPLFLLKYIVAPLLSPFLPELAPFNAEVTLKVNKAPSIENISNDIFVCENKALSTYFNVSDVDLDVLEVRISPTFPFFVSPSLTSNGKERTDINLFSALLDKKRVNSNIGYGFYSEILSASDGGSVTTKQVNISVIEINNEPNLTDIGVQTVWTVGEESTFYYQAQVNDTEDGTQDSRNFIFSLEFLDNAPRLFDISNNGTMLFTPDTNEMALGKYNISVYNLTLCAEDRGIIEIHQNITDFCGQNGGPVKKCDDFSLTLTDENRAPVIVNYSPSNLSFNTPGLTGLYFNITTKDPDGTIPDLYWYVDSEMKKYTTSNSFDEFRYSFPCGTSGIHKIKAIATDGLLNTTLEWNATVLHVSCPVTIGGGGGGGGGGGSFTACRETWGCLDWGICQDTESTYKGGLLAKEDYKIIVDNCKDSFLNENCGFKVRSCQDVNACNRTVFRPDEIEYCAFVNNPSCSDGVKNCHDDGCELLVDCGGPCGVCPSCSDGLRNQGERGIDCEGPCPNSCPVVKSVWSRIRAQYILVIGIIILLIVVVVQSIRYVMNKQKMESYE